MGTSFCYDMELLLWHAPENGYGTDYNMVDIVSKCTKIGTNRSKLIIGRYDNVWTDFRYEEIDKNNNQFHLYWKWIT
jgi:hypothetical protein